MDLTVSSLVFPVLPSPDGVRAGGQRLCQVAEQLLQGAAGSPGDREGGGGGGGGGGVKDDEEEEDGV